MQISKHIHVIHIPFTIPLPSGQKLPRSVYVYLVVGEKIGLIDSGVAGCEEVIFDYLRGLGKKPTDIDLLIFTHAHPDHIGAAKTIREKSGCFTAAHGEAGIWIEDVDRQFAERPVPGFHSLVSGSVSIDRILNDNDTIGFGGISLEILHTPGHSKDSISLFCPEGGALISGDAVPRPGDLPIYEDPAASVQSIKRLQQTKKLKTLLSSWCSPALKTDPYSLLAAGLEHLQRIHGLVRSVARGEKNIAPMELCRAMVQLMGLPEAALNPPVARSFAAHLPLLERESL